MAGPTLTQRLEDLTRDLRQLEAAFDTYKQMTDLQLEILRDQASDRAKAVDDLRDKVADLAARNAALEERSRLHEKTSDRGWNVGQAAVVSVISMIGGALLSLLVQLAIKK